MTILFGLGRKFSSRETELGFGDRGVENGWEGPVEVAGGRFELDSAAGSRK
jgi:hypothetical protein